MQKLQRKHKILLIVIAAILVVALVISATLYATLTGDYGVKPDPQTTAKNVILLVGNGMGLNHVRAAAAFEDLALDEMPYSGKVSTRSMAINDLTDGTAAATAMATGVKVYNGRKSYLRGKAVKNMGDYAPEWGKKMGIVTSGSIAGDVPAAFLTHHGKNTDAVEIAKEIATHPALSVALGGGAPLFQALADDIAARGGSLVGNIDELLRANGTAPVIGAFDEIGTTGTLTLSTLTAQALRLLENENGFFLLVETDNIDAYSRENDFNGMLDELLAFDDAVETAMNYAKNHSDTVVIVTSGHETGDLRLPDAPTSDNLGNDCFHSNGATGQHVGYYAYGSGCKNLPDLIDNTDIFYFISKLLG